MKYVPAFWDCIEYNQVVGVGLNTNGMGINTKKDVFLKTSSKLWAQTDSNRRPSACKADALNQLSYAPGITFGVI